MAACPYEMGVERPVFVPNDETSAVATKFYEVSALRAAAAVKATTNRLWKLWRWTW